MSQTTSSQRIAKNEKGFSLVEIMIVLVIVGSILALIAQRIFGAKDNADAKQVRIMIQQITNQLDMYQQDCQNYPSSDEGLEALVSKPTSCESWGPAPYAKEIPKDPWGQPFNYESDGVDFEIISYGKNRRPGGEGPDQDYSNKAKQ